MLDKIKQKIYESKIYEWKIKRKFVKKIEKHGIAFVIDELISDINKICGEPNIEVKQTGFDKQTGERRLDVIMPAWVKELT
jgi:hypothetical protein